MSSELLLERTGHPPTLMYVKFSSHALRPPYSTVHDQGQMQVQHSCSVFDYYSQDDQFLIIAEAFAFVTVG
jgi:hypothetical protein